MYWGLINGSDVVFSVKYLLFISILLLILWYKKIKQFIKYLLFDSSELLHIFFVEKVRTYINNNPEGCSNCTLDDDNAYYKCEYIN